MKEHTLQLSIKKNVSTVVCAPKRVNITQFKTIKDHVNKHVKVTYPPLKEVGASRSMTLLSQEIKVKSISMVMRQVAKPSLML